MHCHCPPHEKLKSGACLMFKTVIIVLNKPCKRAQSATHAAGLRPGAHAESCLSDSI